MSRWWDTNMADASNSLFSDPTSAINAAVVPDDLVQTQQQVRTDQEQARKDKGGFLGAITGALGKADQWAQKLPGYTIAKNIVWGPVDKTASGMYWLYSNAVSQPISTLLLQAGKADLAAQQGGSFANTFFSGSQWSDAYHQAEHISPGQAFTNYENVTQAAGNQTFLSELFGDAGENLTPAEKAQVKQSTERFLYDTDYWRNKGGWKYNVGSGSLDFMFNILDPVSGAVVGGATKAVKAGRSIEFVPQAAEAARVPGQAGVARTRGAAIDLLRQQQTPAEALQSPNMQRAFDWMKEDGRTVEEIANHPMWGRGRRINPARYDIAKLAVDTPRQNMEQLWRFAVGDSTAGRELAEQAPELLKKIGQVADNRVVLEGTKMNPAMVSTFKANYEGLADNLRDPNLLLEPPVPRPSTPGVRQDGWDRTWGALQQQANINRTAAADISRDNPLRILNPAEDTNLADALKADEWKAAKLDTLASDYDELINNEKYLGRVLGQVDNWSPAMSPLFGAVSRLYRAGGLATRNTEIAAERATLRSAGKKPAAIGGNFVMTTLKRGMGAPMTIIHSFGERTPQGFVNHNADDAHDRVFDMLKRVKGMDPQQRLDLVALYNQADGKVERSDALSKIHDAVLNHILVKNEGMDPELADVLKTSITNGISDKLLSLTGRAQGRAQRFGPAADTPEDISKLTGQRPDQIEDLTPVRSDRIVTDEDGSGILVTPLAQTQLNQSDILLPIEEIQRLASRSSGAMRGVKIRGGNAKDIVVKQLDSFDNLWKFATLLRPGFIPRMVSDEVLARMFKFGGMSTLMDTAKGTGHFLSNRARQVNAIVGRGSYVPTTGRGIASSHAIVALDDESVIASAKALGEKTKRINVPATLRMAYGKMTDEKNGYAEVQKELAQLRKSGKGSPEYIASLRAQADDHERVAAEYKDYVEEILRQAEASPGRRLGDRDFLYKIGGTTYRVPQAFSNEWENPIPRDQISSENAWKSLFTRGEQIDRQRYFMHTEKTGSYKMVDPDQPNYMESWLNAVNLQIRQDPFHRMIAGGMTDKEALNWLTKTAAGRQYMSQMGSFNRDKPQFVRAVRYMIDKYIGDDALKAKIANGDAVTEAELRQTFTPDEFPLVHGEELKEHSAISHRETAMAWRDKYMEKAWKYTADVPADILSRHPTYLQLHQAEMQNLIRQQYHYKVQTTGDDSITPKEWEALNQKAHKFAVNKMRQVVYDPQNTTASQALRFVYPFFKPYIDGLDRWAGLVAERPEQLGKFAKIYNAPVAANLVTDQDGNHVSPDGYATVETVDPISGKKVSERKFVPLKNRVLHLKAPWSNKPGDHGAIRMNSLNTILPGDPWFDPGTGPIIQIPGNELAKKSPTAAEFLTWAKVLPYGPQQSTTSMITPKYLRSAYDAYTAGDMNNEKYQQAVLDIYNMKTAQYYEQMRAGKHAKPPTMEGIQKEAKNFLWLQVLGDWTSPVSLKQSPLDGTPYQFFSDQFKALQKQDPQNARARFLSMFGEDYAGFTDAMSESLGIQASTSAQAQFEKYRDLIEENPDLAPLAIGNVYNGGPFSQTVYNQQFQEEVGGQPLRRKLTAEEAINKGRENQGWSTYMAATNELDAQLIRAGFRSYTDAGAEVFNAAKQQITAALAEQNPAWYKAFSTTNREKIPQTISFLTKMVQDPSIIKDPLRTDAKAALVYLQVRNQFKSMLAQRGLSQVSFDTAGNPSGEAADIGYAWRQAQMGLVNSSVSFAQLFNRYLSQDDLQ